MKQIGFLSILIFLRGFSSFADPYSFKTGTRNGQDSLNPLIVSVIDAIHPDSIHSTLQHMQDYGSRFKLLDNRREIAMWLAAKFLSFGLTDVHIDSFYCHVTRPVDTTLWQYNVEARIEGQSAPGEEALIGAHYDSYNNQDPFGEAPGADDNGSGVAAVLEIARVMRQQGYQPESAITFALFAAEEFGGQGSEYMALKARETGRDIRYMLNLDMIANNPDSLRKIRIYKFHRVESAGQFAGDLFNRYTGYTVEFPEDSTNNETDSYFFWLNGFPATFFIEPDFSPNWHTPYDTAGACNIAFCAEVARGACATLMEDQFLPYPRSFAARSSKEQITLTWKPTKNAHVAGYNLYRSANPETGFIRLNPAPVTDSLYIDQSIGKGEEYYYFLRSVNDSLRESFSSEKVRGVRIAFTDTLLVLNSVADNSSTPGDVLQYYSYLLDTIPFTWRDVNRQHPLSLHLLGTHQNIWWMTNDFNYTPLLHPSPAELDDFFGNGGNILLTAFLPSLLMDGLTENFNRLPEGSVLRSFFKADSVIRKPPGLFYRALPAVPGYDTLNVDPERVFVPGLPGELQNIETYAPDPGGNTIYRYDSHYNTASPQGALKGKPVGLEYIGTDYRTILLSFPLFYMDTSEARSFIHHVIRNKFTHSLSVNGLSRLNGITLHQNYPNPFSGNTTISVTLNVPEEIILEVFSGEGNLVAQLVRGKISSGTHLFMFSAGYLPTGVYTIVLTSGDDRITRKMIHLK